MSRCQALTLVQSIAVEEGYYVHGSRAQRNKNPANIEFGQFAECHGAVLETVRKGKTARFAHFPTKEAGWDAMRSLADSYSGLTVAQVVRRWAPPSENNVNAYLAAIMKMTGLKSNDVLTPKNIG